MENRNTWEELMARVTGGHGEGRMRPSEPCHRKDTPPFHCKWNMQLKLTSQKAITGGGVGAVRTGTATVNEQKCQRETQKNQAEACLSLHQCWPSKKGPGEPLCWCKLGSSTEQLLSFGPTGHARDDSRSTLHQGEDGEKNIAGQEGVSWH